MTRTVRDRLFITALADSRLAVVFPLMFTLCLSGCGTNESPAPDTGGMLDGSSSVDREPMTETGAKTEAGAAAEIGMKPDDGGGGKTVAVVYNNQSTAIDLSKPQPVPLDGTFYARLSDVVLLALPDKTLDTLLADFEGSSGFRPGSKSNCDGLIPVAGETLKKGYIHPQSLILRWEDDLGYPGCMSVQGTVKIFISDK
jgi:hypothetical protein